MGSAEGQVQEKGYKASFPSLINVYGEATYIMVLKDVNGIVKLYALVNVQNYSFAATGVTQTEAFNAYKKLLVDNGILSSESEEDDRPQAEITVEDVRVILVGGESVPALEQTVGLRRPTTQFVRQIGGNFFFGFRRKGHSDLLLTDMELTPVPYLDDR